MAGYTKDSLQAKLAEEAPKIQQYLRGRDPSEELIKSYYTDIGERIGSNAVKRMLKHLSKG